MVQKEDQAQGNQKIINSKDYPYLQGFSFAYFDDLRYK
jgi:hypothetical protein